MIDTAMVSWTFVYFCARFAEGTKLRHTYRRIQARLFLNQNGAQFQSAKIVRCDRLITFGNRLDVLIFEFEYDFMIVVYATIDILRSLYTRVF
jgi:hypothetical protein